MTWSQPWVAAWLRDGSAVNALHGLASLHAVQRLLGRSNHAFTADVYGTVPDALARAEAKKHC